MTGLPSMLELAELDSEPRVHPNGFIQLDLDERRRLHVWHPRLKVRQKTYSPVHDHIFNFRSMVCSGRLVHIVYDAEVTTFGGTHERWQVEHVGEGQSTVLGRVNNYRYVLQPVGFEVVQPGEVYMFNAYRLHESLANEPTMTIMGKVGFGDAVTGPNCIGASVMVPVGDEPDNDFRRDTVDTDELWRLISEAHPS